MKERLFTCKAFILVLLLFSIVFSYAPQTSYACSCAEPGPVSEELSRNAAVFSGKVIDMEDKNKAKEEISSADPIAFLIEVDRTWKGVDKTQVTVYTERSGASCGFNFTVNKEYLVYAYERDGDLWVSLCSRTMPLDSAEADLESLGKGEEPKKDVSISLEEENPTNNYIYITIAIVAVLFIVIYRQVRKK